MKELTHKYLTFALRYIKKTGIFIWKISPARNVKIGSIAGTPKDRGYIQIRVLGRKYSAHRLAVFYVTGKWPELEIDHRDGQNWKQQMEEFAGSHPSSK